MNESDQPASDPGPRRIIFDAEGLRAVFSPGQPGFLVATFNELGSPIHGESFWGDNLLRGLGVAAIGFVSNREWFPQDKMRPAVAAALRAMGGSYQRVVTYGTSMGAYGALKYGAALGADLALAFAPQVSIEPSVTAGWDERYHSHYSPANAGMDIAAPDMARHNLVFYDPTDAIDRRHAWMVEALGRTSLVPAPFGGHAIVKTIGEAHMGRRLVALARAADTSLGAWRGLLRRARQHSPHYFTTRNRTMRNRGGLVKETLRSARRSHAMWPDDPDRKAELAEALVAAGGGAETAYLVEELWAARAKLVDFVALWRLLLAQGDLMRGREMIEERLEREPGSTFLRSTAAQTLQMAGRPNNAYEQLIIAERHAATSWDWNRLADHYRDLGRPADEERARARATA